MGITFDKEPLAAKKNYVIKTVNAYIANDLKTGQIILLEILH